MLLVLYNVLIVLSFQTFQCQSHIQEMVTDMHGNQSTLEKRVNKIEESLLAMQVCLGFRFF